MIPKEHAASTGEAVPGKRPGKDEAIGMCQKACRVLAHCHALGRCVGWLAAHAQGGLFATTLSAMHVAQKRRRATLKVTYLYFFP